MDNRAGVVVERASATSTNKKKIAIGIALQYCTVLNIILVVAIHILYSSCLIHSSLLFFLVAYQLTTVVALLAAALATVLNLNYARNNDALST